MRDENDSESKLSKPCLGDGQIEEDLFVIGAGVIEHLVESGLCLALLFVDERSADAVSMGQDGDGFVPGERLYRKRFPVGAGQGSGRTSRGQECIGHALPPGSKCLFAGQFDVGFHKARVQELELLETAQASIRFRQFILFDEARGTTTVGRETQLVVGAMSFRMVRVLALAVGISANIVLPADAARQKRPQFVKFRGLSKQPQVFCRFCNILIVKRLGEWASENNFVWFFRSWNFW